MLYTLTSPEAQGDRIHLDCSPDTARARSCDGRPVLPVAVRFELRERRVFPLWIDPEAFDPAWTAVAEFHPDGSVTARGPIPNSLFLRGVCSDS